MFEILIHYKEISTLILCLSSFLLNKYATPIAPMTAAEAIAIFSDFSIYLSDESTVRTAGEK